MGPFRHILVATDFGSTSDRALETAAALATHFGAELHVLHVVEESPYASPFPIPVQVRQAATRRLDEAVSSLRTRMLRASGMVREGVPSDEICASATELAANLVVLGSQGRRGLPRFVMGSVAESVVRRSSIPVMTIHPSDHISILSGGMHRFRHVLAPTDFSEASERGVDAAADLSLALDASLTLVHAYELPMYADYTAGVLAEVEAQLRAQLESALGRVRARVPKAEGILCQATPWHGILDVAKQRGADLVVMATHGRHGLERVVLGSVAEKIVRLAEVPVITVAAR